MSVYAYQITADSGCDLSLEKCAERGVMPYKMPFTMDGKPMTDGMTEESFREFYDLMARRRDRPHQPDKPRGVHGVLEAPGRGRHARAAHLPRRGHLRLL